jgi:hypothetical protein
MSVDDSNENYKYMKIKSQVSFAEEKSSHLEYLCIPEEVEKSLFDCI